MNEQEEKISDLTKEGEAGGTKAVKASTENFTVEQQAQPKEKFSTFSGEEPEKALLAAKPGETLEEFNLRTNQYHEEQARKSKEGSVQPFCIGGFEDGSEIVAGGKREAQNKVDAPPRLNDALSDPGVPPDMILLAQAGRTKPEIPEEITKVADEEAEGLRRRGRIDESGHWHFQNPRLPKGQDIAGVLKEWIWNTFNPSPGKVAENNLEFLYQFLTGTGKHIQEHTEPEDAVLKDFMQSPGADSIRKQFKEQGYPTFTDKLGYGTFQAAVETVLPHRGAVDDFTAFATTLPGDPLPTDMVYPNWGSVAAQVGGFGKPPKEYPWATATAMRCDANGKADSKGDHVQFQIINIAGKRSFELHLSQDKAIGELGPERSIIQVFRWTEPVKPVELKQ